MDERFSFWFDLLVYGRGDPAGAVFSGVTLSKRCLGLTSTERCMIQLPFSSV